ncbi:unnamed protein product [Parajaminaea phylloscopi]
MAPWPSDGHTGIVNARRANKPSSATAPIAATISAVVALIVLALIGYALHRKRRNKAWLPSCLSRRRQVDSNTSRTPFRLRGQPQSDVRQQASAAPTPAEQSTQTSTASQPPADAPLAPPTLRSRIWRGLVHAFSTDAVSATSMRQHLRQAETGQPASSPAPPERRRRDRNVTRLRRTDSGESLRTVPEYKSEHGHDEVVLYKAVEEGEGALGGMLTVTTENWPSSDDSSANPDGPPTATRFSLASSLRNSLRRSLPQSQTRRTSNAPSLDRPAHTFGAALGEVSESGQSTPEEPSSSGMAHRHSVAVDIEGETPRYEILFPTQSVEVLPQPSRADLSQQSGADETHTAEEARQSGFGAFFARLTGSRSTGSRHQDGNDLGHASTEMLEVAAHRSVGQHRRFYSSVSALSVLTPSTFSPENGSRIDLASGGEASTSQSSRNASRPSLNRERSEAHLSGSVRGRTISNPLSETLIHLPGPRANGGANWTEQQRRFMTSMDSLTRYGVPVAPPPRIDDSSEQDDVSLPPPP